MADGGPYPIIRRHTPGYCRCGERITILVSVTSCQGLREAFLDWFQNGERLVEAVLTWPDVDNNVLFLDPNRFQYRTMAERPVWVRQDREGVDWISGIGDDARATLLLIRSAA